MVWKPSRSVVLTKPGFFCTCVYLRLYLCAKRAAMFAAVVYLGVCPGEKLQYLINLGAKEPLHGQVEGLTGKDSWACPCRCNAYGVGMLRERVRLMCQT